MSYLQNEFINCDLQTLSDQFKLLTCFKQEMINFEENIE